MKTISFESPHRQRHFEFFREMNHPHFNICANVDITDTLTFIKENGMSFTPTIVYLVARVANEIQEFRWRIREKDVVEHERVDPSFTVWTEAADVFSFCEVPYDSDPGKFVPAATAQITLRASEPSFDDAGRDDLLFLSSIPWVSFISFQHAMPYHPCDSVPRITWGKYFEENGRIKMPLSVQAHHAIVDGRHVGAYFNRFETLAVNPQGW